MKKNKLSKISELKDGSLIYGVYYCFYKEQKKTRYGDPFLNLALSDSTGNINGKLWENSSHYDLKFNEGDIVSVKAKADVYRSQLVLNILHINKFNKSIYSAYGFNPDSLVSSLEINTKDIWKDFMKYFSKTGVYKNMIKTIYKDYKTEILKFPYEMSLPFQKEHSYICTIYRSLKVADALLLDDFNKDTKQDIIYALIFLKQFYLVTSYEKNIIYSLKEEASKRGEENMFYDIFKTYKKTISPDDYFILEKSLFDSKSKDYLLERDAVSKVFGLIDSLRD